MRILVIMVMVVLAIFATDCGSSSSTVQPLSAETLEYVGGHWVPFISLKPLSKAQWAVVDAYADFSSAVLAVYTDHSVDPLATVISPHSRVLTMFQKFLTEGKNPDSLYRKAIVESVNITGCRARLTLELYYSNRPSLNYISSWVRPFNAAILGRSKGLSISQSSGVHVKPPVFPKDIEQYAPWLFVGDNRVGGYQAPCGI
jgi:hypothetical protein